MRLRTAPSRSCRSETDQAQTIQAIESIQGVRHAACVGFLYLLVTIIGLWAAKRVKNTADYAIAGRHLPLIMIVTTTFATWFGSETVLGIGAKFVQAISARWLKTRLAPRSASSLSVCSCRAALQTDPAHHQRLLPPALRQVSGDPARSSSC